MINEDIITALKNAVERGDTLDNAIEMALNSGYSKEDVEEASKFVGGVPTYNFQPKSYEELTMPAQKDILGNPKKIESPPIKKELPILIPPQIQNTQIQRPQNLMQTNTLQQRPVMQTQQQNQIPIVQKQQIPITQIPFYQKQEQMQVKPISREINYTGPRKNYSKEILLLMILLFLLGILIATFVFKEKILNFLSNL